MTPPTLPTNTSAITVAFTALVKAIGSPPLPTWVTPLQKNIVAMVTTNEEIPILVTNTPFRAPATNPMLKAPTEAKAALPVTV
ncbi:hypothetical protein ES703_33910 [subsurface metagenome]